MKLYDEMVDQIVEKQIHPSWSTMLADQFAAPYFSDLSSFLKEEYRNHVVYPPMSMVFNAFNLTPFDHVKVVILGQDPYHGPEQAHGLSFSVQEGTPFPPSLRNILKELTADIGCKQPHSGDLSKWAYQGVLLLNASLTVRHKSAGSHQKSGWETFTDACIQRLSDQRDHLVFLLWGNYARAKKELVDRNKHLILEAAHPSPFSAHKGFFGTNHFSKTNAYLQEKGKDPVDWRLA